LLDEVRSFVRRVAPEAPPREPSSPANGADVKWLSGVKILIAEDDMRTVYALSALLRSLGAEIVVADTGKEALELLDQHPDIQLVLMDVMMPEMDGYEAMRQLRADSRYSELPVVALTAKAMQGERQRCLGAGANEYLPKPVEPDQLLGTVRGFIAGGASNVVV
jgi:CheY-like chemotaxis protein